MFSTICGGHDRIASVIFGHFFEQTAQKMSTWSIFPLTKTIGLYTLAASAGRRNSRDALVVEKLLFVVDNVLFAARTTVVKGKTA